MWLTAFLLGLLGSFHCVGMCAPIALMLPFRGTNGGGKIFRIGLYFFGKTLSYILLGVVFSILGKGLFIADYQQIFSILVGVGMILFVILSSFLKRKIYYYSFSPLTRLITRLKKQMAQEFRENRSFSSGMIGFLNGFLPCGLVYMALFGALSQGHWEGILIYMLWFSLGTIPLMLAVLYLGDFIGVNLRGRIQKAMPFFIVLIAVLFIIRGLGEGIPYLSPSDTSLMIRPDADCVVPSHR